MRTITHEARTRSQAASMFRAGVDSSSFGPIGHISSVSSDRLKGFIGYNEDPLHEGVTSRITPISSPEQLGFIGDVVREGISRIEQGGQTRLSLRTIVNRDMLNALSREIRAAGARTEAHIPINGDYFMVYIGYNDRSRVLSDELRGQHAHTVTSLLVEGNQAQAQSHAVGNSYSMRIVDGQARSFTSAERESICELLGTFGYDSQSAIRTVSNPMNIIGLVYDADRTVVGISVAERRNIELSDGRTIQIAELTDGVVAKHANGNGLYSTLLDHVFAHIYENHEDIHLVYAESNVANMSLMRTAAQQGRTFGGLLPNHANIMNRNRGELELKSLAITYMTRDDIRQMLTAANPLQEAIRS